MGNWIGNFSQWITHLGEEIHDYKYLRCQITIPGAYQHSQRKCLIMLHTEASQGAAILKYIIMVIDYKPQRETRLCKCCNMYYKPEAFSTTPTGRKRYICIQCQNMKKQQN